MLYIILYATMCSIVNGDTGEMGGCTPNQAAVWAFDQYSSKDQFDLVYSECVMLSNAYRKLHNVKMAQCAIERKQGV